MKQNLLHDLELFNRARRDDDGTALQVFVADCLDQVNFFFFRFSVIYLIYPSSIALKELRGPGSLVKAIALS